MFGFAEKSAYNYHLSGNSRWDNIDCTNGKIIAWKSDTTLPLRLFGKLPFVLRKVCVGKMQKWVVLELDANFHSCFDPDKNVKRYMRSEKKFFDCLLEIWRCFENVFSHYLS